MSSGPDDPDPPPDPKQEPGALPVPVEPERRERRLASRPGFWVAAAAGAFLAGVAVLTVIDATGGDPDPGARTATSPPGSAADPSSTPGGGDGPPDPGSSRGEGDDPAAETTVPATTAPATTLPPLAPLEDGRHAAYLTAVDGDSVELDLIRFLTGEAAAEAYMEDHPDHPIGSPAELYIINEDPRLRTLPVAEAAPVTVLVPEEGHEPRTVAFAAMPDHLASDPVEDDRWVWPAPFWLTVEGGVVVAIEEQFVP